MDYFSVRKQFICPTFDPEVEEEAFCVFLSGRELRRLLQSPYGDSSRTVRSQKKRPILWLVICVSPLKSQICEPPKKNLPPV